MTEDVSRYELPTGEKLDLPKMKDLDQAITAAARAGTIAVILMGSARWVHLGQYTRDAHVAHHGDRRVRTYRGYRVIVDDELDGRAFEIVGMFQGVFNPDPLGSGRPSDQSAQPT